MNSKTCSGENRLEYIELIQGYCYNLLHTVFCFVVFFRWFFFSFSSVLLLFLFVSSRTHVRKRKTTTKTKSISLPRKTKTHILCSHKFFFFILSCEILTFVLFHGIFFKFSCCCCCYCLWLSANSFTIINCRSSVRKIVYIERPFDINCAHFQFLWFGRIARACIAIKNEYTSILLLLSICRECAHRMSMHVMEMKRQYYASLCNFYCYYYEFTRSWNSLSFYGFQSAFSEKKMMKCKK